MKKIKIPIVSFLVTLAFSGVVQADDVLDRGLRQMAVAIAEFLDEERLTKEVIVGNFTGPPRLRSSGGVEIRRSIIEQLEDVGIQVSETAELQLMGRYRQTEAVEKPGVDEFSSIAMEIEAKIMDGNDQELVELPIKMFGSGILQITGASFDIDPRTPHDERQEELKRQSRIPSTQIVNAETRASAESPFGLEVLVRNGNRLNQRIPSFDGARRSFVELHRGEEYLVRLHNRADFEVAVKLTIDGVSMFVGAEDISRSSELVIRPMGYIDVPGWYITNTKSKAFEVGGYEESVAKQRGNSSDIGTINAAFRACWSPEGRRPADEPSGEPRGGKATKLGRDLRKDYERVLRDFGELRALISVRYDR